MALLILRFQRGIAQLPSSIGGGCPVTQFRCAVPVVASTSTSFVTAATTAATIRTKQLNVHISLTLTYPAIFINYFNQK
jgi:hypothetical protein